MEDIRELVLLTQNKSNVIKRLLEVSSRSSDTIIDFYNRILEDELDSDHQAAHLFFQSNPQHTLYQKLKSDLLKRLVASYFYIELEEDKNSDRRNAFAQNYYMWAVVKSLKQEGASSFAQLCKQIHESSIYFEFTDLVVRTSDLLAEHALIVECDIEAYEQFSKQSEYYQSLLAAEDEVELMYSQLAVEQTNQKSWDKSYIEKNQAAYSQVEDNVRKYDSYRIRLCGYLIESGIYLAVNDYKKVAIISQEAIDFFKQKSYDVSIPIQIFLYQKLFCDIQLRDYGEAEKTAVQCNAYLQAGTYNWFKFREAHFILLMHTGAFQQAYRLFNQTVENSMFSYLPENIQEIWLIYEAYLVYLIRKGKIELQAEYTRCVNFSLAGFLMQTQIYSKDKKGQNISIQIIHLLILMLDKEELVHDRMEALKKYSTRYVSKVENKRSHIFVRLLHQLKNAEYDQSRFKKKTDKLLQELREVEHDLVHHAASVEIIPYEVLWDLILD